MKLTADRGTGNYIQSFAGDAVLINGERYTQPVIVSAERIVADWPAPTLENLAEHDIDHALALEPEVILLGTGASHRFVSNRLATAIMARGIGFEVMNTAAACRTYNILLAEDRRVAAILFIA